MYATHGLVQWRNVRIQTWLLRSFLRPFLTNSYASSFRPIQFNINPFIACVSIKHIECLISILNISYLHALQTWDSIIFVSKISVHFCIVYTHNIAVHTTKWSILNNSHYEMMLGYQTHHYLLKNPIFLLWQLSRSRHNTRTVQLLPYRLILFCHELH